LLFATSEEPLIYCIDFSTCSNTNSAVPLADLSPVIVDGDLDVSGAGDHHAQNSW
jgi:hypothetical protein